jgi:hypothetical protein
MSRGISGSKWEALKTKGKSLQHDATYETIFGPRGLANLLCNFSVVGEVGLEPTKA